MPPADYGNADYDGADVQQLTAIAQRLAKNQHAQPGRGYGMSTRNLPQVVYFFAKTEMMTILNLAFLDINKSLILAVPNSPDLQFAQVYSITTFGSYGKFDLSLQSVDS
eukprot:353725-Chlamydomonas_euryale.AAC.5